MNNQNKQDNPKVERSPDKIIEYVNHFYSNLSYDGRMKVCIDAVRRERAARITELEALNYKYKEALERIRDWQYNPETTVYQLAEQALNHKDNENG